MVKKTADELKSEALELRKKGYNCAQCVAMVFNPELEATTAALGTGVAATGHICGAANALAIVTATRCYQAPDQKQTLYSKVRTLIDRFRERNMGQADCRDLRKPGRKPCTELICDAIDILHEEGI